MFYVVIRASELNKGQIIIALFSLQYSKYLQLIALLNYTKPIARLQFRDAQNINLRSV